jgi:hypothetical protein
MLTSLVDPKPKTPLSILACLPRGGPTTRIRISPDLTKAFQQKQRLKIGRAADRCGCQMQGSTADLAAAALGHFSASTGFGAIDLDERVKVAAYDMLADPGAASAFLNFIVRPNEQYVHLDTMEKVRETAFRHQLSQSFLFQAVPGTSRLLDVAIQFGESPASLHAVFVDSAKVSLPAEVYDAQVGMNPYWSYTSPKQIGQALKRLDVDFPLPTFTAAASELRNMSRNGTPLDEPNFVSAVNEEATVTRACSGDNAVEMSFGTFVPLTPSPLRAPTLLDAGRYAFDATLKNLKPHSRGA